MKLSQIKNILKLKEDVKFKLINWDIIPEHFHITEIWLVSKKFIDCGWSLRENNTINFQLRTDEDFDHRLSSSKLLNIIDIYQKTISDQDFEVDIEYQDYTIGIYTLDYINNYFVLMPKITDCLAKDKCGITQKSQTKSQNNSCCWWWCC